MNGPRPAGVVVAALIGLFLLGFGVTLVMKVRGAGDHADRENTRRQRMKVDPAWPDWFRNLDRNTDGVLTRAEFLGTDEQFRRTDTDGDGLISPAEATAADAWFRNEVPR